MERTMGGWLEGQHPTPSTPRGLLNAYMPGMLTRLLSGLLPVELGAYTGACGEAQALSGELKVAGPSLSTAVANIAPGGKVRVQPYTAVHCRTGGEWVGGEGRRCCTCIVSDKAHFSSSVWPD